MRCEVGAGTAPDSTGSPRSHFSHQEEAGYKLLHPPREEPWGQTVVRLQSPEGAIVSISYIPVFHDES
jgi:hypothetical protein